MKVIYSGLMIEKHNEYKLHQHAYLKDGVLPMKISNPHITFKLRPNKQLPDEVVGKAFYVKVTGYGNDGRVQGFRVELPDEIKEYYENDNVPHITVSKIEEAAPKETGKITFQDIKSFIVKCRFGYFTNQGIKYSN